MKFIIFKKKKRMIKKVYNIENEEDYLGKIISNGESYIFLSSIWNNNMGKGKMLKEIAEELIRLNKKLGVGEK